MLKDYYLGDLVASKEGEAAVPAAVTSIVTAAAAPAKVPCTLNPKPDKVPCTLNPKPLLPHRPRYLARPSNGCMPRCVSR